MCTPSTETYELMFECHLTQTEAEALFRLEVSGPQDVFRHVRRFLAHPANFGRSEVDYLVGMFERSGSPLSEPVRDRLKRCKDSALPPGT
jgi:hypothetical protein